MKGELLGEPNTKPGTGPGRMAGEVRARSSQPWGGDGR